MTRALSPRFSQALQFAAERHADQLRKGTQIPYVAHLLGVAGIALEYGADEDEVIGALLHDSVEDGKATLQEIRERFGDAVADIVAGCSDTDVIPKPPWRARKEAYVAHVATASRSVQLVSAADKLHNAQAVLRDYREVGERLWERFNGGRDGTLWYYRALVSVFRTVGSPLADELDRVISELESLAGATVQSPR
jgi:(p)ppGpp synthase/HD superfamily hydrolase